MGLIEQIRDGASLKRSTIVLNTDVTGSGSVNLGATYAILNVGTSTPCRLRLYENEVSRDNQTEKNRSFGLTNITTSIALVGDFSMSAANTSYQVDPVLYGVVTNPSDQLTYYRIDDAISPPIIYLTTYLLEDRAVTAGVNKSYVTENRRTLPNIMANLAADATASGVLTNSTIPTTYLLVSASLSDSSHYARLRLYNVSSSLADNDELKRQFRNEPSASTGLIVDAILTGSVTTYFIPKIIGANLNNMGTNLVLTDLDRGKMDGSNELYYHLENKGPSTVDITASLHVYALEE